MKVLGMGLDWKGKRLYQPIEEAAFTESLIKALSAVAVDTRTMAVATTRGTAFRGEQARRVVDRGDPKAAGWSFLVAEDDPRKGAIIEALAPLATVRAMADPAKPLLFKAAGPDQWQAWITDHYYALDLAGEKVPGYVLIAGGPTQVPFGFQALMDSVASVGRVDFDKIDDLAAYVAKLLRL
ncbi:MAG TPA: hypothetical protein VFU23_09890, partial [Gemmatimonadales bacterium]|nr:hypothetical protein [Gemmatimonadales bacterium]